VSHAGSATAIVRGRVITLAGPPEPARVGLRDVQGLAMRDGRIVASGSVDEVEATATSATIRIDLAPDEITMPALTDGHLHLADAAVAARELRLESAATLDDGLAAIAVAASTLRSPGEWLRGGGWDASQWEQWPAAADLERVAPGRPVLLWSNDLHSVWCSPEAFRRSGVTASTADPPGGVVRRLDDGTPAGVLHEDATQLVTAHAPVPAVDELADLIVAYGRRLLSLGVVAVHDPSELEMDSRLERGFAAIERLAGSGLLPVRVHAGFRRGALDHAIERGLRSGDPLGPANGRARVGWLKLFADGTLGSRTAALLDDYSPDPELGEPPAGRRGLLVTDPAEMRELAERAAAHGIATSIHAIGDRALRHALDALEPTRGRTALRPRIEHVQLVANNDITRLGRSGITASIQPADLRGDAAKAQGAWRERLDRSYPWRALLDARTPICFGTDAPAADDDPWPAIAMATTRWHPAWGDGAEPYEPQNGMSLAEALRAACVGAAETAGEHDRGRLAVGQRADLVVVPAAVLTDPEAMRQARPRLVMMDGEVVFEA
jgi:predicted amidohydrolase YtcJ